MHSKTEEGAAIVKQAAEIVELRKQIKALRQAVVLSTGCLMRTMQDDKAGVSTRVNENYRLLQLLDKENADG